MYEKINIYKKGILKILKTKKKDVTKSPLLNLLPSIIVESQKSLSFKYPLAQMHASIKTTLSGMQLQYAPSMNQPMDSSSM